MNIKELKWCRISALFGANGAFLMFVGNLCLCIIYASPDSSE